MDDNLSNEYYIKGTEAFKSMLETENIRRRQQNGNNCIAVKSLKFNGKLNDHSLAKVLLLSKDTGL